MKTVYALTDPVDVLPGVGPAILTVLNKAGVTTLDDLIHAFPYRWEDFSQLKKIRDLQVGDQVSCVAQVVSVSQKKAFRKRRMTITEVVVSDGEAEMKLTWFHFFRGMGQLSVGSQVLISGVVRFGPRGRTMTHPVIEVLQEGVSVSGTITPLYSSSYGLSSFQLHRLITAALSGIELINDPIPVSIRDRRCLVSHRQALAYLHAPQNSHEVGEAQRYFAYLELLPLQMGIVLQKEALLAQKARKIDSHRDVLSEMAQTLPYALTQDQKKSIWAVAQDMDRSIPMNRLVEGDVGSGKTMVAFFALLLVATAGYQGVLLAPTEVLASQHFQSAEKFFADHGYTVALITAKQAVTTDGGDEKRVEVMKKIAAGSVDIVIGTHALLSKKVQFHEVGLVVVDEQHRFGVNQRKNIKDKTGGKLVPHFLSLTATPIPRTLALALYGDLDISLITQKPAHQKEITSRYVAGEKKAQAYEFVRSHVAQGSQVYIICPLIEQSEGDTRSAATLVKKAVLEEYGRVQRVFPEFQVAYLHGRMKKDEQEKVLDEFRAGAIHILVATSIVEVGVDIPNATIVMIENAERFGLSQLHQLRGRVGRGEKQSYCLLFSDTVDPVAQERLRQFANTSDGFALSEFDLSERGPGQFWGIEQSGFPKMHFARLNDVELLQRVREDARILLQQTEDSAPYLYARMKALHIIDHRE